MASEAPAPAPAPPPPPAPTPAPASAWHEGIDSTLLGLAQNKGWKYDNPKEFATSVLTAYREAERRLGVPADQLLRLPQPNAAEADVRAFYDRLGVPSEPKDYDLSAVKFSSGKELDPAFSDAFRAALHQAHVSKDRAADVVRAMVTHMEHNDAAEAAERTALIQAEQQALKLNWGRNTEVNLLAANSALKNLAAAVGLDLQQAGDAWDALSKVGGINASKAMDMLRVIGSRMSEGPPFVSGGSTHGNSMPMTREAAKAEIDSLKNDKDFRTRLLNGSVADKRRWTELHQIWQPPQ